MCYCCQCAKQSRPLFGISSQAKQHWSVSIFVPLACRGLSVAAHAGGINGIRGHETGQKARHAGAGAPSTRESGGSLLSWAVPAATDCI